MLARDLAWMLYCGDLVDHCALFNQATSFELTEPSRRKSAYAWLDLIDKKTQAEQNSLLNTSHYRRLGLYCEALFELITTEGYAAGVTSYRLLKKNIQIFKQHSKVTLGELDFLVEDINNNVIHIEMANKFYLLSDSDPKILSDRPLSLIPKSTRCIGPNRADRLDLKVERLLNHQMAIIHTDEAKVRLDQLNINYEKLNHPSQLLLKGQIFSYFSHQLASPSNTYHLTDARWCHLNCALAAMTRCEKRFGQRGMKCRWVVLEKMQWLSSLHLEPGDINNTFSKEELEERLIESENFRFQPPILCELYIFDGKSAAPQQRLMVVKDTWPNFESPSHST